MPLIVRIEKATNDLGLVIAVIALPAYRRAQ